MGLDRSRNEGGSRLGRRSLAIQDVYACLSGVLEASAT